MSAVFTAFVAPEPALEERNLNEVCADFVRGHCSFKPEDDINGENYHPPHELFRIWDPSYPQDAPTIKAKTVNKLVSGKPMSKLRFASEDDDDLLDGPGNLALNGVRHDNDHEYIVHIRILPTTDEVCTTHYLTTMVRLTIATDHLHQAWLPPC